MDSDVQKRIAEIRQRWSGNMPYSPPFEICQKDVLDLLSIITADNGYVRGLEDAKATAEYFFDQRDAKFWSPIQTQGGIVEEIESLISQQEVKEP